MSASSSISRALTQSPLIAVTLYLAVVGGLATTAGLAIADIIAHQRTLAQTSELLAQLQGRHARSGPTLPSGRSGAPLLEGPPVTVAGASLLQRVGAAVSNAGGTIQSSQVDVSGAQGKEGLVGLVVSCEMEQSALQKVLYDLEAGMPFLFVDQLDVQVPQATATNEGGAGKIRVVLGVTGQWQGPK